ncbi:MAG: hypothetical protein PVJ57_04765 [Phycisphaerae bacterium]|jgi:hypothetical protein
MALNRLIVTAGLSLVLAYAATAGAQTWSITTVDSGKVGDYPSLALQPSGYPAISYADGKFQTLKYAWFDGKAWQTATAVNDETPVAYTSLAFVNGEPAISYYEPFDGLGYAWFVDGEWQSTIVHSAVEVESAGLYSSLAVLPDGNPAISYMYSIYEGKSLTDADLMYAWFDGTQWQRTTVDTGGAEVNVGEFTSLAVLPSGYPAISYVDATNHTLKYAWYNGSLWHSAVVDSSALVTGFTSLAIVGGEPAISYGIGSPTPEVRYAEFAGGEWHIATVDSGDGQLGSCTSLAVLPNGEPAMAYGDAGSGELHYAWRGYGAWHSSLISSSGAGNCSLAFVAGTVPVIAFHNMEMGSLNLAALIEDCNENGIPDIEDLAYCQGAPWCSDCNGNGILDQCDISFCYYDPACGDCDLDGVPDGCQYEITDCNENGFADGCEIAMDPSLDCNENGILDECDRWGCDGEPWCRDCNENGILDVCDQDDCAGEPWCDDCNGNGFLDECDVMYGVSLDINVNDVPDECEPDCNENSIPDDWDISAEYSADCNANGIPDECDIADGTSEDCNGNGVPDECDLANGDSEDCDVNGVPDECQTDTDDDGVIDACDGCPQDPAKLAPGTCGCGEADTDTDGDGFADCVDNCPDVFNPDQADSDGNGLGDACDEAARPVPTDACFFRCLIQLMSGKPLDGPEVGDCNCDDFLDELVAYADEHAGEYPTDGDGTTEPTGTDNLTEEERELLGRLTAGAGICPLSCVLLVTISLVGLLLTRPRGASRP